ncbi:hypothetical protein M0D21_14300 [Aquimarina sp. D1M17]|uniref:hypothetical protein n=1 Tax=Aquimarina acroporae TaxID=2937283 RepID=UPI0020BEDE07|nr:hypothetical protein [Aquimarina acroporae]MCK8522753.1 hypothetical protein [Aquimarina acroporae]
MKKIIVFCLSFVFLVSCKSNGNSDGKSTDGIELPKELRVIKGKVVDRKKKKVPYAAVKLYLDDNDCMYAYTGEDGSFEFEVEELRIKDQTHFEVVYTGFAKNMLSLRNFENGGSIVMSTKGNVIPVAEYNVFYEAIKSCSK